MRHASKLRSPHLASWQSLSSQSTVKNVIMKRLVKGSSFKLNMQEGTAVLSLIQANENSYLVEWVQEDGTRKHIHVAGHKDGDARQLWINGRTINAERVRARGNSAASADASLAATIPAVVSQILVTIGDEVEAGDKLILLESMKMVIPIQAPYAGTVSAIHCTAGESVQAGIQLINLEANS